MTGRDLTPEQRHDLDMVVAKLAGGGFDIMERWVDGAVLPTLSFLFPSSGGPYVVEISPESVADACRSVREAARIAPSVGNSSEELDGALSDMLAGLVSEIELEVDRAPSVRHIVI
jgi:hypothetical protein